MSVVRGDDILMGWRMEARECMSVEFVGNLNCEGIHRHRLREVVTRFEKVS